MQLSRSFGDDFDGFTAVETFLYFRWKLENRLDDANVHTYFFKNLFSILCLNLNVSFLSLEKQKYGAKRGSAGRPLNAP